MSDDLRELAERAGVPHAVAEHFGPLLRLLRAAIAEARSAPDLPRVTVEAAGEGALHPDHAYSYDDAALFLGVHRDSVKSISPHLLPRVRPGRVRGIDVMVYLGYVTPEDAEAYKEAARSRVRAAAADDGRAPRRGRAARPR